MDSASPHSRTQARIAMFEREMAAQERFLERALSYETLIDWSQMSWDDRRSYDDLIEGLHWDIMRTYWELECLDQVPRWPW